MFFTELPSRVKFFVLETGSKTLLCAACLKSSLLAEGCVSSAPALQVRVPAGTQVKHRGSSIMALPFLPFSSSLVLELPASFLLALSLLCATDVYWNPVRQFPLFIDSNVWSCLHRWQIHSSKMSSGREIFTEGTARGQKQLSLLLSWPVFAYLVLFRRNVSSHLILWGLVIRCVNYLGQAYIKNDDNSNEQSWTLHHKKHNHTQAWHYPGT